MKRNEEIMYTILLIIIYLAFISLGLPDAVLGAAWPSMYEQLNASLSFAGIISMIISAGTIISSLYSDKVIYKFGTAKVTVMSALLTAVALLGFSISGHFILLCLWAVPYGLGAGSVDAALNNFVAIHYKARHMSWLHCFWGVGAAIGPYIMGFFLATNKGWNMGYLALAALQASLVFILFISLPLWKEKKQDQDEQTKPIDKRVAIKLRGAKNVLIAFFCYCSVEATTGLWASSYLVLNRGIDAYTAAKWTALFYLGITLGRFISGFISDMIGNKRMIRIGACIILLGIVTLLLPLPNALAWLGLFVIGLGCAPIYPCLIHATPMHFGKENSQTLMGMQMACAYVGTTFMPPIFGTFAHCFKASLFPFFLLLFAVSMIGMIEILNYKMK